MRVVTEHIGHTLEYVEWSPEVVHRVDIDLGTTLCGIAVATPVDPARIINTWALYGKRFPQEFRDRLCRRCIGTSFRLPGEMSPQELTP